MLFSHSSIAEDALSSSVAVRRLRSSIRMHAKPAERSHFPKDKRAVEVLA